MWFYELFGFEETNSQEIRNNIKITGNKLLSKVNNKNYIFGKLEIPSLTELRKNSVLENYNSQITISEILGDIKEIHKNHKNNHSVIQVASQFNLLEMVSPERTPEDGVGIYEYDLTQGPACAISCGAGTVYRNYFVKVNGQTGQTKDNQIDCLNDIGAELKNNKYNHWEMKNGYALLTEQGIKYINNKIKNMSASDYEFLKGKLKIGVQWNTEVTISKKQNIITQVYCSALPVAYSRIKQELWKEFASLILEATYEATLYVALKNYKITGNNKLFLTMVGGGVFGNKKEWILNSIGKAVEKFKNTPLDIKIVSYKNSDKDIQKFINNINLPKK